MSSNAPVQSLNLFLASPLLAPLRELGLPIGPDWPSCEDWNAWAQGSQVATRFAAANPGLSFVAEVRAGMRRRRREKKLTPGHQRSYEARVIEKNEIATRPEHPHDFFNALIWLRYPHSKGSLHRKAYQLQREHPGQRVADADALTCFDEGGLIYVSDQADEPEKVRSLLSSRNDSEKWEFCQQKWRNFQIFGHGILEGLWKGQPMNLQLMTLVLAWEESRPDLDSQLAQFIAERPLARPASGTAPLAALWKI